MSDHHHDITVPRGALVAAAGLIAVTLVAAGTARLSGTSSSATVDPAPEVTRAVRFEDGPAGEVIVRDATTPRVIVRLPAKTGGFIRNVVRSMARERKINGIGAGPPFVIARAPDGRLWISDPQTRQKIDLSAFGQTNSRNFDRLLTLAAEPR